VASVSATAPAQALVQAPGRAMVLGQEEAPVRVQVGVLEIPVRAMGRESAQARARASVAWVLEPVWALAVDQVEEASEMALE